MYDESVDISAASIAAIIIPIRPIGTKVLMNRGIASNESVPAGSIASAAMPHIPGIRKRQIKKKLQLSMLNKTFWEN